MKKFVEIFFSNKLWPTREEWRCYFTGSAEDRTR